MNCWDAEMFWFFMLIDFSMAQNWSSAKKGRVCYLSLQRAINLRVLQVSLPPISSPQVDWRSSSYLNLEPYDSIEWDEGKMKQIYKDLFNECD